MVLPMAWTTYTQSLTRRRIRCFVVRLVHRGSLFFGRIIKYGVTRRYTELRVKTFTRSGDINKNTFYTSRVIVCL